MEAVGDKRRSTWDARRKSGVSSGAASGAGAAKGARGAFAAARPSFSNQLLEEIHASEAQATSVMRADGTADLRALQELQDAIHTVGDKLLKSPRIDTALEYKAAVQKLLQAVLPHIHQQETFSERKSVKTPNGYSVKEYKFTVVAKINKQLDDVLKLILAAQADQMKIMQSLDEMKGLIVDLLK